MLTDTPTYTLGQFNFGTQGTEADKLACNDGVLHMNGRAVFNFAAQHVPTDIRSVLAKNRTDISTVDRFVLHQGSRYIVETIADRLQVPVKSAVRCYPLRQYRFVLDPIHPVRTAGQA